MNKIAKQAYEAPRVDVVSFTHPLSLLVSLSVNGGVGDFELGDGPTEEYELGDEV